MTVFTYEGHLIERRKGRTVNIKTWNFRITITRTQHMIKSLSWSSHIKVSISNRKCPVLTLIKLTLASRHLASRLHGDSIQ